MPTIYQNKLDDFLANNNVMKDNDAKTFTINFVEKEMEADWWISKENQLLFIWHSIYKQVTDQDLYDGKDGNQQIAEDFSNRGVSIRIRVCWQRYKDWIIAYMSELSAEARQQSAEADRRSAEADRRSAEADRRSAEAQQRSADAIKSIMHTDSTRIKKHMGKFYDTYIQTPDIVKQEDIDFMRKSAKEIIASCKEYWINYRAILLKEVWDMKKVDAILKFYGVE